MGWWATGHGDDIIGDVRSALLPAGTVDLHELFYGGDD